MTDFLNSVRTFHVESSLFLSEKAIKNVNMKIKFYKNIFKLFVFQVH